MIQLVGKVLTKVFGSRNERLLKRYGAAARNIARCEQNLRQLSDQDLRATTDQFKQRLANGQSIEELIPEACAVVREASRRAQAHRQFEVQLVGGLVLFDSKVAEMRTGEGKTIVCYLPAYLKFLQGRKVHIVTVNDYLVRRDAEFARPIFHLLGISVGYIQSAYEAFARPEEIDPADVEVIVGARTEFGRPVYRLRPGCEESYADNRLAQYACDITYGTNSEFGFDYLRDNMKESVQTQAQGPLHYAVIDEVDSILIDEARTPLIISGPAADDPGQYKRADAVARELVRRQSRANGETARRLRSWRDQPPESVLRHPKYTDAMKKFQLGPEFLREDEAEALGHTIYYVVERDRKSAHMTHAGVGVAQEQLGEGSLYVGSNMVWPHLIENALRASAVYERDKEYVVQEGKVIIVDEFTGRLMHGRQWSDGLHQAVEAKENVKIKEETQTLATITLQNFFKLYDRIAGMTGTAMTESEEFMKIYKLEVVAIPTNRPVNRPDHNDKIYKTVPEKYDAIVEEIHNVHSHGRPADPFLIQKVLTRLRPILSDNGNVSAIDRALSAWQDARQDTDGRLAEAMFEAYDQAMGDLAYGRPILVGTISVENSEKLSKMLESKYGIEHEVLNAKNHAREAEIVVKAGERHLPARGQERSPRGNVTIATNMAGRGTDIKLQKGVVYEKCVGDLGPGQGSAAQQARRGWQEPGVVGTKCCIYCPDYDPRTNCAHCWKPKLDPRFPALGRNVCPLNSPCGLHIVGTERHEARRIDNQLRGRSGRQGDPGSSRFFLSLGDELLKLFMGEWTVKMLGWLGMEGGMAIEDKRVTKGIERAQKKVEERNFNIRKNLLEYDEVMDHQRQVFYTQRQQILEGKGLSDVIWRMIDGTIDSAVAKFLADDYGPLCMADWARSQLDCSVEPRELEADSFEELSRVVREAAVAEARSQISMTVGEYMDEDLEREQWDLRGLAKWGQSRFGVSLSQNQMRRMDAGPVEEQLRRAAEERIAQTDLTPLQRYMDPHYGPQQLAEWARSKFGLPIGSEQIADQPASEAGPWLAEQVRAEYRRREVAYPVEFTLERIFARQGSDSAYAADALVRWANHKFNVGWTVDHVQGKAVEDLAGELKQLNRDFLDNGRLDAEVDQALARFGGGEELATWARQRFAPVFEPQAEQEQAAPSREVLLRAGRELLRHELTQLERFVLLRVYDQSWKDHMYSMDLLRSGIWTQAYAERDPKIAYKREGFKLFEQMQGNIRENVTDVIFKVRLAGEETGRRAGPAMSARHDEAVNLGFAAARRDQAAAMAPQGEGAKPETIRRTVPKVGRNDPCPCGSGKKYKKCHGARA